MYIVGKYRKSDSMASLISDNYSILMVMDRFDIPLGVSEKSIEEICIENNVNVETFLAIINLLLHKNERCYKTSIENIEVNDIVKYLKNSHKYYIDSKFPEIRRRLINALDDSEIAKLIIQYFDNYIENTKEHLNYEEKVVFPYALNICNGIYSSEYKIENFSKKHDNIDEHLTEFKNVIIKYYRGKGEKIMSVIHEILDCAEDLMTHNMVENRLLTPAISKIEENI